MLRKNLYCSPSVSASVLAESVDLVTCFSFVELQPMDVMLLHLLRSITKYSIWLSRLVRLLKLAPGKSLMLSDSKWSVRMYIYVGVVWINFITLLVDIRSEIVVFYILALASQTKKLISGPCHSSYPVITKNPNILLCMVTSITDSMPFGFV